MAHPRIDFPAGPLAELCQRHGIARLSLFGSVLRQDFGPGSDVDVLIEFLPGVRCGLLGMARIQRELAELIGRPVDLRTPADLSRYFRERVVQEAVEQYAA